MASSASASAPHMSTAQAQAQGRQRQARRGESSAAAAAAMSEDDEGFTPEMRDRQARGKDPYKDDGDDDESSSGGSDFGFGLKTEPFEDRERRAYALSVLDSPEQLMMFAQSANDGRRGEQSIPSQRRRFCAILAGFEPLPASEGGRKQQPQPGSSARAPAPAARRGGPRARRGGPAEEHEPEGEWAD
ncbi:hypothetical protein OCS_03074 [Ophiocordyceps sinensis CO18]|uniref:Uncharacterized protein n=1 Tax=Ophiocordyceps sinensis (strain Co18 / CGMCC 3.14243) TaxID=911162 RepID=T5AFM1_OPHSC|nr:hypothetical protein OCS_03074 [Ophiocordyceps sinensis CO18]